MLVCQWILVDFLPFCQPAVSVSDPSLPLVCMPFLSLSQVFIIKCVGFAPTLKSPRYHVVKNDLDVLIDPFVPPLVLDYRPEGYELGIKPKASHTLSQSLFSFSLVFQGGFSNSPSCPSLELSFLPLPPE